MTENELGFIQNNRRSWHDEECSIATTNRKEKRIQWLDDKENDDKRQEYRRARNHANAVVRRKKREYLESSLQEIENNRRDGNVREQFQEIKAIRALSHERFLPAGG